MVWPTFGGSRAENIEMIERSPSISCRSVTRLRIFSTLSRASMSLAEITTSTSYSDDGKSRVTASYWRNCGVFERNSCESESSTLSFCTPNTAATARIAKTMPTRSGSLSEISPIFSAPKASCGRPRSGVPVPDWEAWTSLSTDCIAFPWPRRARHVPEGTFLVTRVLMHMACAPCAEAATPEPRAVALPRRAVKWPSSPP